MSALDCAVFFLACTVSFNLNHRHWICPFIQQNETKEKRTSTFRCFGNKHKMVLSKTLWLKKKKKQTLWHLKKYIHQILSPCILQWIRFHIWHFTSFFLLIITERKESRVSNKHLRCWICTFAHRVLVELKYNEGGWGALLEWQTSTLSTFVLQHKRTALTLRQPAPKKHNTKWTPFCSKCKACLWWLHCDTFCT